MEASRRKPKTRATRPTAQGRQKPGTGLATCALSIAILAMLGYAVVKRQQAFEEAQRLATIGKAPSTTAVSQRSSRQSQVGSLRAWPPLEPVGLEAPDYSQPYPQWVPLGPATKVVTQTQPTHFPESTAKPSLASGKDELRENFVDSETATTMSEVLSGLGAHSLASPEYEVTAERSVDAGKPETIAADTQPNLPLLQPTLAEPEISTKVEAEPAMDPLPAVVNLEGTEVSAVAVDSAMVIENQFADADDSPIYVEPEWPTTTLPPEEVAEMPAPPIPAMPFMFDAPVSEIAGDASRLDADQLVAEAAEGNIDEIEDAIFDDIEAQMAHDTPLDELLTDTPTTEQVGKLAAKDVREAFNLGRHGALFAARSRFVAVLRKIALAKDAEHSTDRHSVALAAGIRALDEAADFIPRGDALATDLDVHAIAQSHMTPLLKDEEHGRWALPHEAIARYHRYAQHKLAAAVSGDQAGSMALHGLGKSYARLATLGEAAEAERTSLTMYRSAVMAHEGNYLAANELGVGLAKAGRYKTAEKALQQAIACGGKSTVYANLAVVQQKLGQTRLAQATQDRAAQLASREMAAGDFSRERGVKWMEPAAFARISEAMNRQATPRNQVMPQNIARQQRRAAPMAQQPVRAMPNRRVPPRMAQGPQQNVGRPQPAMLPSQSSSQRTMPPVRSQTIVR